MGGALRGLSQEDHTVDGGNLVPHEPVIIVVQDIP